MKGESAGGGGGSSSLRGCSCISSMDNEILWFGRFGLGREGAPHVFLNECECFLFYIQFVFIASIWARRGRVHGSSGAPSRYRPPRRPSWSLPSREPVLVSLLCSSDVMELLMTCWWAPAGDVVIFMLSNPEQHQDATPVLLIHDLPPSEKNLLLY